MERRQALLDYATTRFAESGFHPTSVADIVDGLGVGKGVFYWYFESKDELLLEILRVALVDIRRAQAAAINPHTDPLARLQAGIRCSLRWLSSRPDIVRLITFGWTEEPFATALRRGREITVADTARHISDAIAQGKIPPGNPTLMAIAIRGVTEELGQRYALLHGRIDEEITNTAVRMCLGGLICGGEFLADYTEAPTPDA